MTALTLGMRIALVLLATLAATALCRRRSAAVRVWVLRVGLAFACAMPLLGAVAPSWRMAPAVLRGDAASRPASTAGTADAVVDTRVAAWAVAGPAAAVAAPATPGAREWLPWAAAGWALGTGLLFARVVIGLWHLRRLAKEARVVTEGPLLDALADAARATGVRVPVRLLAGDALAPVMTWGSRRPVVLLPASAPTWSGARLRTVLVHECAHIAGGDWPAMLGADVLRAASWFDPLAWWLTRRLRAEHERAADDVVLATGIGPSAYAAHLLDLARARTRGAWLPGTAMARPSTLERRVTAMLDHTLDRQPVTLRTRALLTAAGLAVALAVAGAQAGFVTLDGTVRDPSGRTLPAATVVLTDPAAQAKRELKSDAEGRFSFVGVPPGAYRLDVNRAGFRPWSEQVTLGADLTRDVAMRVGTLQETITVTGQPVAPPPDDAASLARRAASKARFEDMKAREQARCAADTGAASAGGYLMPPAKVVDVRPVYPEALRAAGTGGVVTLEALIGTDGLVRQVRNLRGPAPELEAAAGDAVRAWQFTPTWLNCDPIDVEMTVTVTFRPERQ